MHMMIYHLHFLHRPIQPIRMSRSQRVPLDTATWLKKAALGARGVRSIGCSMSVAYRMCTISYPVSVWSAANIELECSIWYLYVSEPMAAWQMLSGSLIAIDSALTTCGLQTSGTQGTDSGSLIENIRSICVELLS